jgi:vacuolar-type H+-ATPase subunit H
MPNSSASSQRPDDIEVIEGRDYQRLLEQARQRHGDVEVISHRRVGLLKGRWEITLRIKPSADASPAEVVTPAAEPVLSAPTVESAAEAVEAAVHAQPAPLPAPSQDTQEMSVITIHEEDDIDAHDEDELSELDVPVAAAEPQAATPVEDEPTDEPEIPAEEAVSDEEAAEGKQTSPLMVWIGVGLFSLVDPHSGGTLLDRVSEILSQVAADAGEQVTPTLIQESASLSSYEYVIMAADQTLAQGHVSPFDPDRAAYDLVSEITGALRPAEHADEPAPAQAIVLSAGEDTLPPFAEVEPADEPVEAEPAPEAAEDQPVEAEPAPEAAEDQPAEASAAPAPREEPASAVHDAVIEVPAATPAPDSVSEPVADLALPAAVEGPPAAVMAGETPAHRLGDIDQQVRAETMRLSELQARAVVSGAEITAAGLIAQAREDAATLRAEAEQMRRDARNEASEIGAEARLQAERLLASARLHADQALADVHQLAETVRLATQTVQAAADRATGDLSHAHRLITDRLAVETVEAKLRLGTFRAEGFEQRQLTGDQD